MNSARPATKSCLHDVDRPKASRHIDDVRSWMRSCPHSTDAFSTDGWGRSGTQLLVGAALGGNKGNGDKSCDPM